MKKSAIILLLLSMMTVLALPACGVLQEPEQASGPIEAIPLETLSAGVEAPSVAPPVVIEATEPALDASPADATTEQTAEPEAATDTAEPATEEPAPAPSGAATVFTLDSTNSQVRFQLQEDLRGARTTVIGVTDQVAGQLSINLADLSQTQVGIIQINARTLATDNNMRNRAIQNEILETGAHEFITFTPTGIQGLPTSAAVGQSISFTISGDLTIRDITMPATFNVEATAVSDSQITGTATATVNRADFDLRIPSVPSVANVDEQVQLFIDFTANAS